MRPITTIRSPWMRYAATVGSKEYLAIVSYFRLADPGVMPKFLWNALRIGRQLSRSEGLLCYSTGARFGRMEFWSTSVWEDVRALVNFVRASPHSEIMATMKPCVMRSEFMRWTINGASVPPSTRQAEALLHRKLSASGPDF